MSIRSSNQIITISLASKNDILSMVDVGEEKITVIHNGCNAISYSKDKSNCSYIVAITSGLPHKNADGIVNSYFEYVRTYADPLPITIIGIPDINKYDLPDEIRIRITCIKFIKDDRELHKIIANAKMFLFLSLIEGFGFPPIEAMQLGVPVICSRLSSLPEVVSEAAVLVDPTNYKEVAGALNALLNDEERQNELIIAGYQNYERFSWESRAKLYWDILIN
jgi:glycosyltransferase involved in cell wall biosynthesis